MALEYDYEDIFQCIRCMNCGATYRLSETPELCIYCGSDEWTL